MKLAIVEFNMLSYTAAEWRGVWISSRRPCGKSGLQLSGLEQNGGESFRKTTMTFLVTGVAGGSRLKLAQNRTISKACRIFAEDLKETISPPFSSYKKIIPVISLS
jgi:hypothetical protein